MPEQTITCPSCGTVIPLTEALSNQIKEDARKEFEGKAKEKELEIKRREEEVSKRLKDIEDSKRSIDDTVAKRLAAEKTRVFQEAEKRAKEGLEVTLKDLREENAEKDRKLNEARLNELEFRKKARELEERQKSIDLEIARKIDSEKEKIRQTALEMFSEEHRLKDLEKDKVMNDMRKTIEELKRKSEQGSMQTQGEVLELDLELLLRSRFPIDVIEPVAKGIKGADIIQNVFTRNGQPCGSIAWELKRTKAWNDEWITKIKDDQREMKSEAAVIVSETLPKGVASFSCMEGVWVTSIQLAPNLAEALRVGLIQVAQSRISAVGKNEKMEAMYNYLTGSGFRQKIEAIVEAFKSMREDLEQEKRAITKSWSKREKQIERVIMTTAGLYGDMQGIVTLPEIKSFELSSGDSEDAAE